MQLIVQFKSPENFTTMVAHDIFRKLQAYTPVKGIKMTAHVGGFVAYELTTSAESMSGRRADALNRKLESITGSLSQRVNTYGWADKAEHKSSFPLI